MAKKPTFDEKLHDFLIFQHEKCPTSGRDHWQGYVEMKKGSSIMQIQQSLELNYTTHLETRIGSAWEAAEYCAKPDTAQDPLGAHIYGPYPEQDKKGKGHRTDLKAVAELMKEGKSMKQIAAAHPIECMKYPQGIKFVKGLLTPKTFIKPEIKLRGWQDKIIEIADKGFVRRQIIWNHSYESGTGKTTFVEYLQWKYGISMMEGLWNWENMLMNYDDHKVIYFNIPRDEGITSHHMQILEKISDGGQRTLGKYEGGIKDIRAVIIVTSNEPPPYDRLPKRFIGIEATE